MDIQIIRKLVKIVTDAQIAELEIEEESMRVRITRTLQPDGQFLQAPVVSHLASPPVPAPPGAVPAPGASSPADQATADVTTGHEVRSPIVGTFYRAPSPDAEPFVQVGDTVTAGQTICIIEAMKIMNEIEADASGKILKILVENAQPVEYNQPLFVIDAV
ncbi:MAG: acetyl-CoA carboxylase biotin carboxyl carrier protein [Bacteroidetes bacterium]|nr:acetyl-CoA carboxylase biotin carboxyl carrier protein [Bacteroidota bacterium]